MKTRGFIALVSAVIISAVLLIVAVTGSFTGFLHRGNVLDSELKSRSAAAADACADQAFLLLAEDATYTGISDLTLNPLDSCSVDISDLGGNKNLEIHGVSRNAHTNLEVVWDSANETIVSWKEVPSFP